MASLFLLLVTNLGHLLSTLESSTGGAINTTDSSVTIGVNPLPLVGLESAGSSSDLLDNFSPV